MPCVSRQSRVTRCSVVPRSRTGFQYYSRYWMQGQLSVSQERGPASMRDSGAIAAAVRYVPGMRVELRDRSRPGPPRHLPDRSRARGSEGGPAHSRARDDSARGRPLARLRGDPASPARAPGRRAPSPVASSACPGRQDRRVRQRVRARSGPLPRFHSPRAHGPSPGPRPTRPPCSAPRSARSRGPSRRVRAARPRASGR